MNDTTPKREPTQKNKRYLMEIRGFLHVDAPNGEAAREAVQAWIDAAVKASAEQKTQPADDEPVVRVGWLRSFPED